MVSLLQLCCYQTQTHNITVQAATNLQVVDWHQKSLGLDTRNQKELRYKVTQCTAPTGCFAAQAGPAGNRVSNLQRGNDVQNEVRSAGWELEESAPQTLSTTACYTSFTSCAVIHSEGSHFWNSNTLLNSVIFQYLTTGNTKPPIYWGQPRESTSQSSTAKSTTLFQGVCTRHLSKAQSKLTTWFAALSPTQQLSIPWRTDYLGREAEALLVLMYRDAPYTHV